MKQTINSSLNYTYISKISSLIKAHDIVNIIKESLLDKSLFINEDMVTLLCLEILLNNINELLFKRKDLKNYIFELINKLKITKKYYSKYEYNQIIYYCETNNLLSAENRIKILEFLGIKDFQKQQEIISTWEYPYIILGMFFPKIRENFKQQHNQNIEKKLLILEQDTATKIKEVFNLSADEVKKLNFFKKIITIVKILMDKTIKIYNRNQHMLLNNTNITQLEANIFYENFSYIVTNNPTTDKNLTIFIATEIEQFDKKDLINTGLKVNDEIIWQVKSMDQKLIFVADNATIEDIAKTLNGYKNLNKQIKKLLGLKNVFRINSFVLTETGMYSLEDKNRNVNNEISTSSLITTTGTTGYIEMLAAA
jgi:hypothetical protein